MKIDRNWKKEGGGVFVCFKTRFERKELETVLRSFCWNDREVISTYLWGKGDAHFFFMFYRHLELNN